MAATYDGSTMAVVVDEQRVTLATTSAALLIGGQRKSYASGITYYFTGEIDELRVWNRALTGAELTALARDKP